MLDADAVINNSSQKVEGSNAYPDPAPKKVGGSGPRKTHSIYAPGGEWNTGEQVKTDFLVMSHLPHLYNISSKTETGSTLNFISTFVQGHYSVIVICHSEHCGYFHLGHYK